MQATGVLLLLCTSAYWVLTEAFPTTAVKDEIDTLVEEILSLLNSNPIFSTEGDLVTLPSNLENKECCKKNLKTFMNATEIVFKKNIAVKDGIYHNLESIQNFILSGCISQECPCGENRVPPGNFKEKLKNFLDRISICL